MNAQDRVPIGERDSVEVEAEREHMISASCCTNGVRFEVGRESRRRQLSAGGWSTELRR